MDLHKVSYQLHKELAQKLNLQSYRELPTLEVYVHSKGLRIAPWLDREGSAVLMDRNTAQVTPFEFTNKVYQAAEALGTRILYDRACGLDRDEDGRVTGVVLEKAGRLAAKQVVIALGPWSGVAVEDWLDLPLPMEGLRSTSLILSKLSPLLEPAQAYACFCEEDENACHLELYPRPNGDLYVCGCGGSDHVFGDRLRSDGECGRAEKVAADEGRAEKALASLRALSSMTDNLPADHVTTQACMRPVTPDGWPVMGEIPGVGNAFISAGHNCWGILWAPACGLAMADLLVTGQTSLFNMQPFTPERYLVPGQPLRHRGKKMGVEPKGEQW